MSINISYLYYDLLNLYGESGNILAIKNYFDKLGIKVNICYVSINDNFSFENTNLIYIGSGTESNQLIALNHLMKYKKEISEYIDNNGLIIATGNAFELFGNSFDNNGKTSGLGIFSYDATDINKRVVNEGIYHCNLINDNILGFQNHNNIIDIKENYLFSSIKLKGYSVNNEGLKINNFYGTYLVGPLLARNPKLLKYICDNLIKSINSKFRIKKVDFKFENEAYKEFVGNYYNN